MQLILGMALLLQQESAEQVYQKIESVLQTSGPLKIRYKMNSSNKYSDGTLRTTERVGTILLKEGNKARIEVKEATTCTVPHPRNEMLFISDGRRMRRTFVADGKEIESRERDTPKNLSLLIAVALSREGDWSPLTRFLMDRINLTGPLSHFEHGADDAGAKTIQFMLSGIKTRLWYDPKDYRIMKQTWSPPSDGLTHVQTFEEFKLHAEIPDETFALPAAKAPAAPEQLLASRVSEAKHDLSSLNAQLGNYRFKNGSFPSTEQGLDALYGKPRPANERWECLYFWVEEPLLDPWGNPYGYRFPGSRNAKGYDLYSCGADGKPGTEDDVILKDGGR